jgi:hypothetical protein
LIYEEAMGIPGVTLPPDPIQLQPTYEGALAAFEGLKQVSVLFDNGAGGLSPGQPYPGFEESFEEFPVPGTEAHSWYLSPSGALSDQPPEEPHADGFTWDAHALPPTDFTGDTASGEGGLWTATPGYEWEQGPPGSAVSYLSEPLAHDTTVIGAGAVEAWVRSSAPSVDLQATISEVRPDGKETFVQNGWVRGSERKLDSEKSTPLEPVLSLRESDVSPLPSDHFTEVTIPLYYEGHVYRAGSRIRVTIAAPNGTQPIWSFAQTQPDEGGAEVAIAYGNDMPSRLLLPVVPGLEAPSALPPCPGLRGEPCREYVAFANRAAEIEPPAGGEEPPGGGEPPAGGTPPASQGGSPAGGGASPNQTAGTGSVHRSGPAGRCRKRHHRKRHHHGKRRRRHGEGRCHHTHHKRSPAS